MKKTLSLAAGLALLAGAAVPAAAAVTKHTQMAAPTGVKVKAGPGYAIVSWTKEKGSKISYTVSGGPRGGSCTVVDADSCNVPVTSAVPVQYTVTASSSSLKSLPSAPTKALPTKLVLVVAGQSNAMGAESYAVDPTTKVNYLTAPYASGADQNSTIVWDTWFVPGTPNKTFSPLDTPQIFVAATGKPQIFGPEIGLARQLYADGVGAVGVIKVAFPNTSLGKDWSPMGGNLYGQMTTFVKAQMALDAKAGVVDVLGAFYWYQGESDALDATLAAAYQANLSSMIASLRSDLPFAPGAPVVLAKESMAAILATQSANGGCPNLGGCTAALAQDAQVRAADDWAAANLANVATVDTLGLTRNTVGIHLSNVSELAIGNAMAKASETYLHSLR